MPQPPFAADQTNHEAPAVATPHDIFSRWPGHLPLAVARREADWVFALPRLTMRLVGPISGPAVRWLDPLSGKRASPPVQASDDPFAALDLAARGLSTGDGCWIGSINYALGGWCEPSAQAASEHPNPWPLMEFHRCDDAWLIRDGRLSSVGTPPPLGPESAPAPIPPLQFRSVQGRAAYTAAVRTALGYIRAGDIYETNLAHQLVAAHACPPRALARALFAGADPVHGAYIELTAEPSSAIVSLSPESFLTYAAKTRTLTTHPMKGTRAVGPGAHHDLLNSLKDQAELHMITDLMRNDLGRVCEMGSVRVANERRIDPHAAGHLLQATSVVEGTLRADLSIVRALRWLIPAGSITGAPKIRAMQVIDELEPFARGPWCGCCALLLDSGDAHLNVAIRTARMDKNTVTYPVGAGIVADSDPEAEWAETLAKASVLRAVGTVDEV